LYWIISEISIIRILNSTNNKADFVVHEVIQEAIKSPGS
jgi:hypothetical protein